MTPERFARVKEVFLQALVRREDAQRRFLDEACGGDPEVRQEVESLLQYHVASPGTAAPEPGSDGSKGDQSSNE